MARTVAERRDLLPVLGDVFREHGFEGASLSIIGKRTGLGKGSLYHFFPGGKEEMAAAVLAEIENWFEARIFEPLRGAADDGAIIRVFDAVEQYYRSGRRVCLVGSLALNESRDLFGRQIEAYFARWNDVLVEALVHTGHAREEAEALAEDTLAAIQGGLVMARAMNNPALFTRALTRVKARL